MNWFIIVACVIPVGIVATIIMANAKKTALLITSACLMAVFVVVVFGIGMPLSFCRQNIYDKYDWYIETRLKYAESEGIEKMYLEMNDVMTYNLWYERNKEDLENPWSFKSSTGCEFDYIKVGD